MKQILFWITLFMLYIMPLASAQGTFIYID